MWSHRTRTIGGLQHSESSVSSTPSAGSNVVVITHKPNIIDALGKDWFEVKEGEASIFKPDGGSYKLLARVQMDEWPRIAGAAKK